METTAGRIPPLWREWTAVLQTLHPVVTVGGGSLDPGREDDAWPTACSVAAGSGLSATRRTATTTWRRGSRCATRARAGTSSRCPSRATPKHRRPGSAVCTAASPASSTAANPSRRSPSRRAPTGTCSSSVVPSLSSRPCSTIVSSSSLSAGARSPDLPRTRAGPPPGVARLSCVEVASRVEHLSGALHHRWERRPGEVDPPVGAPPHVLALDAAVRLLVHHGAAHVGD